MATAKHTTEKKSLAALVKDDADLMKMLVKETLQAFLEEEMDSCIGEVPLNVQKDGLATDLDITHATSSPA